MANAHIHTRRCLVRLWIAHNNNLEAIGECEVFVRPVLGGWEEEVDWARSFGERRSGGEGGGHDG
jgi:hypothetical protein